MTTELATAPAPIEAPAVRPRIFSGIQPSGVVHLGNDLGAVRNYVRLQAEYEAIYCIVDYHALTSTHDGDVLRQRTREMAASLAGPWARSGPLHALRPEPPARGDRARLAADHRHPGLWLERTPTYKEKKASQPDDVNHGLLTYPVLQAADIIIYKASLVPVGKDQAAHLELSREIVRAFNARYGPTFPEPQAVFTEAPIVLGTDGVRKMSKSLGNTIDVLGPEELIRKQVMSMVTDTQRILRTDPGRPEVCNVCQLQPSFGDDYEDLWEGERTARTGCVDMKKLLAERIIARYAPARERYLELMVGAGPDRRDPGRGCRADPPDRRGDDGRSPGEDGLALMAMLNARPGPRDRRLLSALLVLAVVAVFFYVVEQLTDLFFYFGDIFLTFFLAWLLAFIISPIVSRHRRRHPAAAARGRDGPRLHRASCSSWS